MSWRTTQADYLDELYDVGEEAEDNDDEDDNRWTPSPVPPDEPHTSLERRRYESDVGGYRERSRSPIVKVEHGSQPLPTSSSGSVKGIFDHDLERPRDAIDLQDEDDQHDVEQDLYLTPDAHAVYVCLDEGGDTGEMKSEDCNEGERDVAARNTSGRNAICSVRGGRSGHVCVRGRARRSRGGGRRRRVVDSQHQLVLGPPLKEIWISDDDVPSELRNLERDAARRRALRAQEMRDRAVRNVRDRDRVVEAEKSKHEEEDEFQDATDRKDDSLLLEGDSILFEWSPMDTFRPKEELFTPESTGSVECHQTPYNAFRSFWDNSVIEHIVDEMNQYAQKISSSAFQSDWHPTNAHEVMCLFAFWIMLGIVRMPTIKSCFTTDPLLKTEIFRKIFTEKRYVTLTRALQFIDSMSHAPKSSNSDPAASSDLLHNFRPIITHMNTKFQENYIPSKDICLDESLVLWKVPKNGIKTFELCESATGYLWSFIVYTAKEGSLELQQEPVLCKSTAIIRKLVDPLLNKGYRLFMDNYYNSPLLARFLKRNGTDCVGTVRPNRQDLPVTINQAPLKQGQLMARHSGDVCVLSWQDKQRITMISTCHGSAVGLAQVPSKPGIRPLPFKPQLVLDYNRSMGGVDLKDQMLEPYMSERKRRTKWSMKFFKRLLNVSILNSRILLESSLQCRQDHLNFPLRLVDAILTNHLAHCPVSRRCATATNRAPDPCRMAPHIHWPTRIEDSEAFRLRNRKTRVRCVVCLREGRRDVRTPFKCEGCNVPLCVENCFKNYHTT